MALIDEIREQPAVAQRLLASPPPALGRLAAAVGRRRPSTVVLAARGTSDNAALYAQYLFAVRNSMLVALATPAALTLYGARPRLADALVIGISQSGRSPDIVAVVEEGRRQGALTLAVTNEGASPLAAVADEVVELGAGDEHATAATKTYTSELVAMALLSFALDAPTAEERAALAAVPEAMATALATEAACAELAARRASMARCVVLGRGYEYATAREWALKLQELAQVHALAFSAADFEHGPLALADPELDVLAVAPSGRSLDAQVGLLQRLHGELGARLLVLSASAEARHIDAGIALPADVAEWAAPAVSILPGQLFAYHLTRARGLDPDAPRTISKVTETR
jgi:glucosamine--fructose-6-phosphate aminotransferase (isomerizing)